MYICVRHMFPKSSFPTRVGQKNSQEATIIDIFSVVFSERRDLNNYTNVRNLSFLVFRIPDDWPSPETQ
jgi:hypothetical protein